MATKKKATTEKKSVDSKKLAEKKLNDLEITLSEGEEITEDTLIELNDGKGEDE